MSARVRHFPRFDRVERAVHWSNATLFLVLLCTGASLYFAPLSTVVAHRHLVKTIHVYCGLLLPVPLLVGLLLPSGQQLRRDLSRINRWTLDDRRWWSRRHRATVQLGKFNPGQKLNAIFVGAAIVLMLGTGSIMRWFEPFPDSIRTGATFVHDWVFITLLVVIVGHIMFALSDFDSLRSMVRGWVPEQWARRERPQWWAEIVAADAARGARGANHSDGSSEVLDGNGSATPRGDVEARGEQRVGEARVGTREVPVDD